MNVLQAQVPVHEEPRHHLVFQNTEIRMLNVLIPPGDTSQYHIHKTPSVFIFFTSTNTGSQLQGKTATSGKSAAGRILFENLASPNIRVHRVWNADKDTFHVMDVEVLSKDTGFLQQPLSLPDLKLEIDTAWIRAYRLSMSTGKEFILKNKAQSFILVSLNNAEMQTEQNGRFERQTAQPGTFFEIKRRHSFSIKNTTNDTVEFFLLELPE
ncbi:hypothetical protein QTN47_21390 [Danxiaibacter flavus]|uniref:Quercetin 2,3-dioxygenase C-terminal cupin domain-containing protein n=1 Tax=Danxiaibacter flavus TaxID=3049108 RepID=A0ABV3ZJN0_9BACT|nr:hypothetical protein QNM32_21395 [Chitinophagaceae bacterium DXS]